MFFCNEQKPLVEGELMRIVKLICACEKAHLYFRVPLLPNNYKKV